MKKLFLITALLSLCATAEMQAQTFLKTGITISNGEFISWPSAGPTLGVEKFLSNKLSITGQGTYFLPFTNSLSNDSDRRLEVGTFVNYHLTPASKLDFYFISGLSAVHQSRKWEEDNVSFRNGATRLGLNFGAGVNFNLSHKVVPYVTYRLNSSSYLRSAFSFGAKFRLKGK